MNFIHQIERLQKLNKLIEQEKTGTPDELARRLGISKRQLHNLLEALKNIGAKIEYIKKSETYRFKQHKIKIHFSLSLIEEKEIKKIYGGILFFPKYGFSHLRRSEPTWNGKFSNY